MHKILVETEFKFLASLGYEIYRPPYLSSVRDQSVSDDEYIGNLEVPEVVLAKLSSYNFFYNEIDNDIAELLNQYFDVIVVTINPDWLRAVLRVFDGKIIYRCYGQIGTVSESLIHNGSRELIENHENFFFIPHAPECLDDEQSWLCRFASVVPYWLTQDVLRHKDTWRHVDERRKSIALSCPNISNEYYNNHFKYLKTYFEERCFRYYGVQLESNFDPNVVGTLSRKDQLSNLRRESGYLYTYRERNVCYLPPIEMMILGGPVLFLPGSLLARYFDEASPGLVKDEADAVKKSRRLMANDSVFIDELVESQSIIRYRYTEEYGKPLFEDTFKLIIDGHVSRQQLLVKSAEASLSPSKTKGVLIFSDLGGFVFRDGEHASIHGIPRVMRQIVRALNSAAIPTTVVRSESSEEMLLGFFSEQCQTPELITTLQLDHLSSDQLQDPNITAKYTYAIVSHYHLFPEANDLGLDLLAYIPDYIPHFFRGRDYFIEPEDHITTGARLTTKAKIVLTNSTFSANYLPFCKLGISKQKIINFPLPFLGSRRLNARKPSPTRSFEFDADATPFAFYPTQPHPHKRLDILVMAWILANTGREADLDLVLTAGALPQKLLTLVENSGLTKNLHLLPGLNDSSIEYLYQKASCLAFSSEMEGNFPTQILEAIYLDCPVVCMDMPLITTELGELAKFLQISPFGDVESFASSIIKSVECRSLLLHKQGLIKAHVLNKFSFDNFRGNVIDLHQQMLS